MPHPYRRTPSDVPGLDVAELKSWQGFVEASVRLDAAINRRLTEAHRLTVGDLGVLKVLVESEGGRLRMGNLAGAVGMLPGHLTKRIQRLERRGLVQREQCPEDRRGVVAAITCAGRLAAGDAAKTFSRGFRADVGTSVSTAQLAIIEKNCDRILARLRPGR